MIIDTHAHYDDEAYDGELESVLDECRAQGVRAIITCGTDFDNCQTAIDLARQYKEIYAAVGIYPHETHKYEWDADRLRALAESDGVVAIGEIGLDYHYDDSPRSVQLEWAELQLELANKMKLPVTFHDREAHGDTLRLLKKYKPRGAVHCFSGSVEMAREITKLGMYLGIGGVVTFKNARTAVEVVEDTPLERILLETDAPYMTPSPFRGKRNQSDYIIYTAERIACIKGISVNKVLEKTAKNAVELFKLGVRI